MSWSDQLERGREMTRAPADDLLDSLGLMRKSDQASWIWPALGGVAVGLCAGVALGMALAPRPGRELRAQLGEKWRSGDLTGMAETARGAVRDAASSRSPGRASS
jgi:hypothetical protein